MQNDELLKMLFKEMNLTQFYKYLSEEKYSQLKPYARGYTSICGITNLSEKTFPK